MNITPSKMLLGLSIAAYTYCSWDHISPPKKPDPVPSKPLTLTVAMVNKVIPLSLGRDAFDSSLIDRGVGDASGLPGDDAADPANPVNPADAGAAQNAANAASAAAGPALALQGVFMTPEGHAALINGTPVTEGEAVLLGPSGPKILATKIGEDYAVIICGGRTSVLKLSDPQLKSQDSGNNSNNGNTSGGTGNTPAGGARNAVADPYAGHRTNHHFSG